MMDLLYEGVLVLTSVYQFFRGIIARLLHYPLKRRLVARLDGMGICLEGEPKPGQLKVTVHSEEFYYRLIQEHTLGLAEGYMEGLWDCEKPDEFCNRMIKGGLYRYIMKYPDVRFLNYLRYHVFNLQTAKRSWEVAEKHYDLGNTLYKAFLDETMTYSCGYWRNAKNLYEAQVHKMDLVGRKLKLKPGMRVLELGCGWGGLCKHLAETYKVHVTGVTVSKEGARYGQELCKDLSVDIRCQDYRDIRGSFDAVVAVGILEHVGRKNYRQFFQLAYDCLPENGIFVCHSIGVDSGSVPCIEPFTQKYIFPNGILPDHRNITDSIHDLFTIEDWQNIGADYDKTLMAWEERFVKNWPSLRHLFDDPERFYRMWRYYLLFAAGLFRSRGFQVWQLVLSKGGVPGGYDSVR